MRITKSSQEKNKKKNYKKVLQKVKRQIQGITLIALVVTIIVLLILAGVAINLTVGDNGLFKRAQNAADTWQMAEQNEQSEMDKAADFLEVYQKGINTATTVKDAIAQDGFYLENTKIKDDLQNEVVIPAYFKLASDSANYVEDGIVIEDLDGNQFVWIPAKTEDKGGATINLEGSNTSTIVYQRIDWGLQEDEYNLYYENMQNDEKTSVNTWGGYYIGRYEAGDKESTETRIMRTSESSQKNTITIKKDQVPYNYFLIDNIKKLVEKMNSNNGYINVNVKLVSSYAWDTAISFIEIKNEDYGTNSIEGNYSNREPFTFTDINGEKKTGPLRTDPILTGQTEGVSNIYDMGGNLWEYTTESSNYEGENYINRGGSYGTHYDDYAAGFRDHGIGGLGKSNGFRVALFIK